MTLVERLAVDPAGDGSFRSRLPADEGHVFGGWLVASALAAAEATAPDRRPVCALHAAFVAAGRPGVHLDLAVEAVRDGSSFGSRRVTVTQDGATVLVLTAEMHDPEPGPAWTRPTGAVVPGPGDLGPGRYDNPLVECRDVPVAATTGGPPHARWSWFRVREALPEDPAVHRAALAFVSDFGATRAARQPHAHLADDARRQSVSLDHALWFHGDVDASGWLLSELAPVATGGGRGLVTGSLRTRDGRLVATVAQGVLLRERR